MVATYVLTPLYYCYPLVHQRTGKLEETFPSFVLWKQAVIRAYLLKTLAMALSQIGCAVSPVS